MKGNNRRGVQAVTAATQGAIPGRCVRSPEVEQVELGIVGDALPGIAAATRLPPFSFPRLRRCLQCLRFEAVRWVAGHGVRAPRRLSRFGIEGRDVTAYAVLPAGIADNYQPLSDPRSAGDGVGSCAIRRMSSPYRSTGLLIECDESSVQRSHIYLAAVESNAAIHHVAADEIGVLARHFGIVRPADLSSLSVDRIDHTPGASGVNDAVLDKRCRFQTARGAHLMAPGQSELANRLLVDLIQRTEPMIIVGSPVHHPVAAILIGALQRGVVENFGPAAGR